MLAVSSRHILTLAARRRLAQSASSFRPSSAIQPQPSRGFASLSDGGIASIASSPKLVDPATGLVRWADGFTRSHIAGQQAGAPPLLFHTIGQELDRAASTARDNNPDATALVVVHQGVRWSWRQLQTYADDLGARLLTTLKLQPGDRVGAWLPNCWEYLLLQLACAKAGLVLVTVNPAYTGSELAFSVNLVDMRALVLPPVVGKVDFLARFEDACAAAAPPVKNASSTSSHQIRPKYASMPGLQHVLYTSGTSNANTRANALGFLPFDSVAPRAVDQSAPLDAHHLLLTDVVKNPHHCVNIQFTSGTTGKPKASTLSHFNILNNGAMVGHYLRQTPADRVCIPVPLYHCFGMVMSNLACLTHRSVMVYPSPNFDPEAALRAVLDEKCTILHGVPTMFLAMLNNPLAASGDLSRLRTGIMAGSICPAEIMNRVRSNLHVPGITICYGMTETSPVSMQTGHDDSVEDRLHTVGQIHPHLEVKVVDPITLKTVPIGAPGELLTRGYSVMKGYWANPTASRESIIDDATVDADVSGRPAPIFPTAETVQSIQEANAADPDPCKVPGLLQNLDLRGWMRTGDLATIDNRGYGKIVGRIKDMIIRGGENIFPREIEDHLFSHSLVQNVAVVGLPDEHYGEKVCACIIIKDGTAADWLRSAGGAAKEHHALDDAAIVAKHHHLIESELRSHCSKHLARFKVPKHMRIMPHFPLTVTGKIQKFMLRDQMHAEFQRDS
ncbi:AMP-dependent synthetase and ligase [Capsaspora owczarzaki ATCC 30864]|uniref:AMP-dependent synthetase and ligase n=1 Tax=Capsaspora owczarzaki (strain ATCC 30864) TaxID=595528 RepID=A0A0D2WUX3_CAPO3|nr:AMP-dependent synthetase and ligase [Capsaspora owczarzaki ATCC 30864]KJE95858.1 AMP-dependent synthetase and ligase [Capsaspora owczarzaki ATCC 30864]|eukprot:XP_004345010.2 AMP-dependent synthetase and ligase [Capsaspora owczarzaki ATCC 30864]